MTFLLDQDVPEDLTYMLRELDHGVLRVRDVLGPEAADSACSGLGRADATPSGD